MLNADLAELYAVETRALNQAVTRNIERFPAIIYAKPRSRQYLRTASSTVGRSPKSSF